MDESVDFVPGRVITDNIIMRHELVKGYRRQGLFLRCMIKINMQKANDSLEWVFIEQVLVGMAFLDKFIKWIMQRIEIV